ncbi:MAG: hypothetical protein AAGI52_05595 [Bacteroidota bacterium]
MPFSVALLASPRRATFRFAGETTPLDVRDACLRVLDLPDWEPGTPQVWDFSGVSRLNVDAESWAALLVASRENQSRIGRNRVAVVSQNEDLSAFLDLYARASRSSGRTFHLAKDAKEAHDWIDAPTPSESRS